MAVKNANLNSILSAMGASQGKVKEMPKTTRNKDSKYANMLRAMDGKLPIHKDATGNAQGLPLAFENHAQWKSFYGSLRNHVSRRGVKGYVISRNEDTLTVFLAVKTAAVVYKETK